MGDITSALLKLRPVTFYYKPEYDKGERTRQYGLIAEEVAKVFPDLVAYNPDGSPYTVRYQYLSSILLSAFQEEHHHVQAESEIIRAQSERIQTQQQRIEALELRLTRIESMLTGDRTPSSQAAAASDSLAGSE